jgi:hypothetical protein
MPEAEDRLIALLGYCKEIAKLHTKPEAEQLRLVASKDEGSFVLHEDTLRRLQQLRDAHDSPFVSIVEPSEHSRRDDAVWVRVRRPEGEDRKSPLGQAVCAVYASLFTAHQEVRAACCPPRSARVRALSRAFALAHPAPPARHAVSRRPRCPAAPLPLRRCARAAARR